MRLKYQLRGLGIGIILTAALLMIFSDAGDGSVKADDTIAVVADEETKTVEESLELESEADKEKDSASREKNRTEVMEEFSLQETSAEVENSIEEGTEIASEEQPQTIVEEETVSGEAEKNQTEENEESEPSSEAGDMDSQKQVTDTVRISIVSGDDSGTVARKLQMAGLVGNASEFDAYLMQHGYDKKISVGEKEIAIDATWLEIAEKISRR